SDIHVKGALECLDGEEVVFADDSHEPIDLIVWATGDKVSFPFFQDPELRPKDNRFPLFKRMMKPGYDNLFFMALAQPLSTLVNFAEQQSKLVAAYLAGRYALPHKEIVDRKIASDEELYLSHFYDSPRHTMQVDLTIYVDDLLKKIARGEKRAKQPDANVFRSPRAALQAGAL
ncbi:MAG: NAD(P)/FAD-dependent oxidoreductase, partial [Pseudomonadota bacterium]